MATLAAISTVFLGNLNPTAANAEEPVAPEVLGTVIDGGGAPVAAAQVSFCTQEGDDDDFYLACDVETTTDASGAYSFPLDQLVTGGRYVVNAYGSGFWGGWLGGGDSEPSSLDDNNSFVAGATDVELDAIELAAKRFLTGKVVDPNGAALAEIGVGLYDPADTDFQEALESDWTAGDGTFRFVIPRDADSSSYVLGLRDEDGVTQSQGIVLGQVDLELEPISYTADGVSVVTGRVVDTAGNPVAGVSVASLVWNAEDGEFWNFRSTETADDGSYSARVRPGERFSMSYGRSRYATTYLGGGHSSPIVQDDPVSTRLAAAAGEPNAPLPVVVLEPSLHVTGTFTAGAGGRGVTEVEIAAYPVNHAASDSRVGSGWSDNSGGFELWLPAGSYDLVLTTFDAAPDVVARTFTGVTVTEDTDLGVLALEPVGVAITGHLASASAPVAGATVTAYYWDEDGSWEKGNQTITDASGNYRLVVEDGKVATLRARRNGFQDGWLGSGLSKPDVPGVINSFTTASGLQVSEITLFPTSAKLGKIAGQELDFCTNRTLAATDDGSTNEVRLPFPLKFFGLEYKTIYVNNNGNVSFGESLSEYTPSDLTSADQEAPMIAPFFADVDTRNDASYEVTYGASPDGKTFCVNWATVGYFEEGADKLNIFQLLLTARAGSTGRVAGDFDITMNYDQVQWESGSASGGSEGLGGRSAGVGYTAGTGDPGTFFELAGSRVPGSFLDAGPRALVGNQLNSSQVGRYRFEIRNADANVQLGGLTGSLVAAATQRPVAGATLNACRVVNGSQSRCQTTRSLADGSYWFPALPIGSYEVEVSPPGDLHAKTLTATVNVGSTTDLGRAEITAPQPIPSGTTLTSIDSSAGVPVVYYAEPLALSIPNPCVAGEAPSGTWKVLAATGEVLRSGGLDAAGSRLTATIAQLYPYSGSGRVETAVSCAGTPTDSPRFDIYIDPSGTVYDDYGVPVAGATVTLLSSDTSDGTFTAVPDGSTQLSPGSRNNPVTLGADGRFHWDVASAWYKVRVERSGCESYTSAAMEVPPERIDLAFKLNCGVPTPTAALAITGTPTAGSTLTATGASYGGALESKGFRWLRDDVQVGTGDSYAVVEADYGHTLKVEQTLQAPPVTNSLDASVITFAQLKPTANLRLGLARFSVAPAPAISAGGALSEGATLTANLGSWQPTANLALQWNRDGRPIGGATGASYQLGLQDLGTQITLTVTATRAGFETVLLTSAAVSPPLHLLTATPAPQIAGKAKAGSKLTAKVAAWAPAPVTLRYEWLRGSQVVGSGLAYKVQSADGGSRITFRVTGGRAGFAEVVRISTPTKVVPLSKLKAGKPKIIGAARAGATLRVSPGRWTAGTTLSYQWFRGGTAIPGATGTTYLVSGADVRRPLKVKVVGFKQGYKTVAKTSKATKKVK